MLDRGARGIIATGDPRALRDAARTRRVQAFFHRGAAQLADHAVTAPVAAGMKQRTLFLRVGGAEWCVSVAVVVRV